MKTRDEMLEEADACAQLAFSDANKPEGSTYALLANYWLERALSLRWIREEERREALDANRKKRI